MAKKRPTMAPPKMVYAWRENRGFTVPAQVVGESIAELEAKYGMIKPEHFVEEASAEDSPLHNMLEWDDTKAGRAHRLYQARSIIRCVYIKRVEQSNQPARIAAFVSISDAEDGRRYVPTIAAMSDADQREMVLHNAREDLMRWRNKYEALEEFSELFVTIDRVTRKELVAA